MKKRVVAFGTFDLVHPGHIAFLTAARKLGDELVVVVTRDARVLAEKGRHPLFSQKERVQIVAALKMVDRAVLGDPVGVWRVMSRLKPHAIAVGHDQPLSPHHRQSVPVGTAFKRIRRFGPIHHTSQNIKRLIYAGKKTIA